MSRPNRKRTIEGESNLAERVAQEREAAGLSYEKIEKGNPRRRVTVDELLAFSEVFDVGGHATALGSSVSVSRPSASATDNSSSTVKDRCALSFRLRAVLEMPARSASHEAGWLARARLARTSAAIASRAGSLCSM